VVETARCEIRRIVDLECRKPRATLGDELPQRLHGAEHSFATARTYRSLDAAEVAEQKKAAAAKTAKAGAKK
jgi:hypothetical protein